ncbi:hypothetical protein [Methanolapillus millepedarum]|uniref:Uncharacterized protein n=1 Tax=Methanolapillus millepedarum TaxID=3028296 RepID=A0AA96V1S7_9EURY|nr:hypothetical protein MsAc7_03340 [Methanosarcinaceae archaeon Ac7]
MSMPQPTPIFKRANFQHGNDADKPASPQPGDQYQADNTGIVYFCFTAGVWTPQEIPVQNPLTQNENGNILYDGNPVYTPNPQQANYGYAASLLKFSFGTDTTEHEITIPAFGYTDFLSTASTKSQITENNIICVYSYQKFNKNGTKIVKTNTDIYPYRINGTFNTFSEFLGAIGTATAGSSTAKTVYFRYPLYTKAAPYY